MADEYEKYREADGSIDLGAYSMERAKQELEEPERKIVEPEDLRVFKPTDELSDYIWDVVHRWEYFTKKTLGEQCVRAADSVQETWYWTEKARKRKLLTDEEYGYIQERLGTLPKELNATIRNIKQQQKRWKGKAGNW